mmetsp:Transcript_65667/g.137275  ORF Transcript_65667/g.137275 Transcript_65667/m.137275 type:complete len:371 (-) Transcript_65667:570-1682(-)|eukprot:CAMPEP_0206435276 /NCGR_PEP_ID=MMETSP0324_2-20121206/9734_1 /ASSEMBLY_ACC=CAM_ASM_000836 /TAXON_ID=2866 /ORGANISM="Crypthecodinium cohnii, Strain Seligo" /LENGTH=370 /DNA_ID=CAMNT_0053902105 /DNA_START=133 /DNA_END=1245 /DNA_ORIENTATION=+
MPPFPPESENMPADKFIQMLEDSGGCSPELIAGLKHLAEQGLHPYRVLQHLEEKKRADEEKRERMLSSFDLEGIAQYIAEKECKKVVVMCGAGISTSAGIPDFRSPGTGLYDNLQKYNLPSPEAIFEVDYFLRNPSAFYELAKEMWPGNWKPTPAHYFIKLLHDKGILLRCYTQNIDSLECVAGVPEDKLIAAHGNFDKAHVVRVHDSDPEIEVPIEELKKALDSGKDALTALSYQYGGLVKPKIVFFGESLPERFLQSHHQDLQDCDLLIVLGTSLVVAPFNSLVGLASPAAPRLLINRDPAGTCSELSRGFRFEKEGDDNWRDVFHKGDCDGGCRALAQLLGWKEDLEALIESGGKSTVHQAPWASAL